MAGRNDFLIFDEAQGNTLTQQEYQTHEQRSNGVGAGLASSRLHNKLFHQVSMIAAALGEVIKNKGLVAADDDLPSLVANLTEIIGDDNTIQAHLIDPMPHRFTDESTTYKYGLRAENGIVIFRYEVME